MDRRGLIKFMTLIFSSGKTYTMGTEATSTEQDNRGITPRIVCDIFEHISSSNQNVTVSVSMLEIYNENVCDLLSKGDRNESLQIREVSHGSVMVSSTFDIYLFKFANLNFRFPIWPDFPLRTLMKPCVISCKDVDSDPKAVQ